MVSVQYLENPVHAICWNKATGAFRWCPSGDCSGPIMWFSGKGLKAQFTCNQCGKVVPALEHFQKYLEAHYGR